MSDVVQDPALVDLQIALGVPFSREQLEAISAPLEPGVIVAGAGTGKTTVMAARVCHLVRSGLVRPEQVLGLTFTKKAAGELSSRVAAALGALNVDMDDLPTVSTYDAFAAGLVRRFGLLAGVEARARMMNGAERYVIAEQALRHLQMRLAALARHSESRLIELMLELDAQMASHLVSLDSVAAHCESVIREVSDIVGPTLAVKKIAAIAEERRELLSLVRGYRQIKAELGLVEFADQMASAVELAKGHPGIGTTLRSEYRVVLLDEYQDTSAAQATLLRVLFSGEDAAHGLGHPVTAVGDEAQAIYGWRGAAAANMRDFADVFRTSDGNPATAYELSINRRSASRIIDVANAVSSGLSRDPFGSIPLVLVADPVRGSGLVEARAYVDQVSELDGLVEWVRDRHERSDSPSWADIAVLARKNADVGLAYRALSVAGIPAEIVGLGGLLSVPEVADVVAVLRLLDNVEHNPSVVQLLSGPRWRIGVSDLAALGRRASTLARLADAQSGRPPVLGAADGLLASQDDDAGTRAVEDTEFTRGLVDTAQVRAFPVLLEAIGDLGRVRISALGAERLRCFSVELAELRTHVHEPVPALVHRVVAVTGVLNELEVRHGEGAAGAAQLRRFIRLVSDFCGREGQVSLRAVLAWLDAESSHAAQLEQATPSAADSVKLLSVHRAKGLEWRHVALIGLTSGVFPNDKVQDKWTTTAGALPEALRGDAARVPQLGVISSKTLTSYEAALRLQQSMSEDRLGYVGVSRAKESLLLSAAHWRGRWVKPKEPSRLFRQGSDLLKAWGESTTLVSEDQVGELNPLVADPRPAPWPEALDQDAETLLQWSADAVRDGLSAGTGDELSVSEFAVIKRWRADVERLVAAERARRRSALHADIPASLSASALLLAGIDLEAFRVGLARPMPHPQSASAVLGTRFHQWVQRRFGLGAVALDSGDYALEARDSGASGVGSNDAALAQLCRAFESGPFAVREPLAVEVPFIMNLVGQQVRGRLDIVYKCEEGPYRFQIIDWKTGVADKLDAGQLSLYRLAWAQISGCAIGEIDAAFYVVPSGTLIRPKELLSEIGVAALVERLRSAP